MLSRLAPRPPTLMLKHAVASFVVIFAWMTVPNAAIYIPRGGPKGRSSSVFLPKSRDQLQRAIDGCARMSLTDTTVPTSKKSNLSPDAAVYIPRGRPKGRSSPVFLPKSRDQLQRAIDGCARMSLTDTTVPTPKKSNLSPKGFDLDGITTRGCKSMTCY